MTCIPAIAESVLTLNRGTDILHDFEFQDDNGNPVSMVGWTVALFEPDAWMLANAAIAWTDQAAGKATLSAAWTPTTPSSVQTRAVFTRTVDGFDDTTNILKIVWS